MSKTFRNQRLSKGWSLRALAEQCEAQGIPRPSDSNLSVIERGKTVPRPELRAVLAELLDLPIEYFDQHADRERVASCARQDRRASVLLRIPGPVVHDWTCDQCGTVNSDTVVNCYKCGA